MMVVIANAKPLLDQVADHGAGPNARLIACLHRAQLDDDAQGFALLVGQFGCGAFRNRGPKSLDVISVVPLEPTIDRAACHTTLGSDCCHLSPVDVRPHSSPAAPFAEVILQLRFDDKVVELFQLSATAPGTSDCLPWLGSSHDRRTMILLGSLVNSRGSQVARSCLVNGGLQDLERPSIEIEDRIRAERHRLVAIAVTDRRADRRRRTRRAQPFEHGRE